MLGKDAKLLAEQGRFLMLPSEDGRRKIVFHREAVALAHSRMQQAFPPPAQFTVSECRELLGSSRKFIVPLLEYFDGAGYTRRRGDKRACGESSTEVKEVWWLAWYSKPEARFTANGGFDSHPPPPFINRHRPK